MLSRFQSNWHFRGTASMNVQTADPWRNNQRTRVIQSHPACRCVLVFIWSTVLRLKSPSRAPVERPIPWDSLGAANERLMVDLLIIGMWDWQQRTEMSLIHTPPAVEAGDTFLCDLDVAEVRGTQGRSRPSNSSGLLRLATLTWAPSHPPLWRHWQVFSVLTSSTSRDRSVCNDRTLPTVIQHAHHF